MKRMIDDGLLDTAAKSFIKHYEAENTAALPEQTENNVFTSIKVAKAKAGARKSINRTIRICAVAAVLMIGLVCALFMGSDEVEDLDPATIQVKGEAYMWENNNPDSKWNGNVIVDLNLTKVDERITGIGSPAEDVDIGAIYEGYISIKAPDGEELYCLDDIEVKYNLETGIGRYYGATGLVVRDEDTGRHSYTDAVYDEYGFVLSIYFKEDLSNIEFSLFEHQMGNKYPERLEADGTLIVEKYCIYVAMDAETREEAINIRKDNFENDIFRGCSESFYVGMDLWN